MADPFRLAFDVWASVRAPLGRHLSVVDLEATDELIADRSGAATPRVMVFGTYNAGKSTLINALVGQEVARVADHPETDRVTTYPWHGFLLDDTPGIDAPIEHEQVTRKHLETSDVVLFVLATDGIVEEERTINEIIGLVRTGKPVRVILNNKSGFRSDSPDFLKLRDRLADNLRRGAVAVGIGDIETLAPIRLVNAASGLRARREGKLGLLANSGLLELEADIASLCEATGKAQMARTICQRMVKQIDLALKHPPVVDGMKPFREAADAVSAERTRLTAVLDHASQEAAAHFQADLNRAVSSGEPQSGPTAANAAADAVTAIIERELRKTQRAFGDIETTFTAQTVAIRSDFGLVIPLPGNDAPSVETKGFGLNFKDAANILTPAVNQLGKEAMVDGLMAVKQVFPSVFKGLGKSFFGKVVPFIGPAIQTVTGLYDAYSTHLEAQREFEREKDRRLALQQQIADAGLKMRWALNQQCEGVIESIFGPIEEVLARQASTLKGQAAILEADHATMLKCKGRLTIALDEK